MYTFFFHSSQNVAIKGVRVGRAKLWLSINSLGRDKIYQKPMPDGLIEGAVAQVDRAHDRVNTYEMGYRFKSCPALK